MNTIEILSHKFANEIEFECKGVAGKLAEDLEKRLALKEEKQTVLGYATESAERLKLELKNLGDKAEKIVPGERHTHGEAKMLDFTAELETKKEKFVKFLRDLTRNM